MVGCSVYGCKSRTGQSDSNGNRITFHAYPRKDPNALRAWMHVTRRQNFTPTSYTRMCSLHFSSDDFERDLQGELMAHGTGEKSRPRRLKKGRNPRTDAQLEKETTARTRRQASALRAEKANKKEVMEELMKPIPAVASTSTSDQPSESSSTKRKRMPEFTPTKRCTATYDFIATPRKVALDHPYCRERLSAKKHLKPIPETEGKAEPEPEMMIESSSSPSSSQSSDPLSALGEPLFSPDSVGLSESTSSDESSPEATPDEEAKFIVYESKLEELMKFCQNCGSPVIQCQQSTTGSMVSYTIECHQGHTVHWKSQPTVNRVALGNLMLAAAVLFTGLSFSKIATWASLFKLSFISYARFCQLQKQYLWPIVGEAWTKEQQATIKAVKKSKGKVILGGDSRCDSPGHNAKYGSYSLMDIRPGYPHLIVDMQLIDVTEVKNSHHMESEGLRRALAKMEQEGVKIATLATDQHPSILKIMREDHAQINHQLDVWHYSKNLTKKLSKKAQEKGCEALTPWIRAITNHLWYCSASCKGDQVLLKEKWLSILSHITGIHQWTGGRKMNKCDHEKLPRRKKDQPKWLKKTTPSFKALQAIATSPSFLKLLPRLSQFCHTGQLESFHSYLLQYCSKRQYFPYSGMKARLYLAALGWNDLQRRPKETRTYSRYSKRSRAYVQVTTRKRETAGFIAPHLMRLMERTIEVAHTDIQLPPLQVPVNLKSLGAKAGLDSK